MKTNRAIVATTLSLLTALPLCAAAQTCPSGPTRGPPPLHLVFVTQPGATPVNARITPAVTVGIFDQCNQPVRGRNIQISLGQNPPNPAVLHGTLTLRATGKDGVARFNDLSLDYLGRGYTLVATVSDEQGTFREVSAPFDETRVGDPCLAPDMPACFAPRGMCADTAGDGLNDAWKVAGGMDFNGDGIVSPNEQVLTNVDPLFPDGSVNPHPSANPAVKDVFVLYDWMELPDQLTSGQPTACTINALPGPTYLNIYYPYHSDQCAFDQHCIAGVCKGHSDAPDPAGLRMVIDAFAAHGIRLHLVKGHALPHANVISYGPPIATCVADLSTQAFLGDHAVDLFTVKATNFNATYNGQAFNLAQLFPVFHYVVFGHRHSCDSPNDCAKLACVNPATGYNPLFNETGQSEEPGNDIVVSMGGFRDRNRTPTTLAQGGTFMHELGHNLGLNHGGPLYVGGVATDFNQVKLNFKPNYLSVMNYNHQTRGIETADPNCAPADYACKTTPVRTRLDYSSFAPYVTPNMLDENNGKESDGLNLGSSDIGYTWCSGVQTRIPGTGPVDFNCFGGNMETWCASGCNITPGLELNHDPAGRGETPNGTPGSGDRLQPFEDWPNLFFRFQCSAGASN